MSRDAVIPFVFESLPVRGAIVQLSSAWRRMLLGHDYDVLVRDVLGHAAAATTLIAQSLKSGSLVTLQITGEGPMSMLVMQCTSGLHFRGLASAAGASAASGFAELVSQARCAITVDNENAERPYQGIVEVSGDSLAASLEVYYLRSAQIPIHLMLVADAEVCGGILLQQMPERSDAASDDWQRLGFLSATLRPQDLADGVGTELIGRLFAEDDVRVFKARAAMFRCRCSRQRAANVLRLLGEDECRAAIRDDQQVVVTCEYCGRRQQFDPIDIAQLFTDKSAHHSGELH